MGGYPGKEVGLWNGYWERGEEGECGGERWEEGER